MNLIVSSPRMVSEAAKDAKWLLSGNNRYKDSDLPIHTYRGVLDRVWSLEAGHAADRARYWLGYPASQVNQGGRFMDTIYGYLLPRTNPRSKALPTTYRLRRAARIAAEKKRLADLAAAKSPKIKALNIARSNIGVEESPFGSNRQKFGAWYGWNGVAWCAIFITYCRAHAGRTSPRTALAHQWAWWARAKQHGLSVTYNPEPGDIVVYTYEHVGFFEKWTNRSRGLFDAVEGNTSLTSNDNGGKVMRRHRNTATVKCFVRWN